MPEVGLAITAPQFCAIYPTVLDSIHRRTLAFDVDVYSRGNKWQDERGRQLADARAVITPNACGSSASWRQAAQSRERLESLRSTITHCTGTGGTTFRPKPAPLMWQAPERPKISSRRSLPTNHWG